MKIQVIGTGCDKCAKLYENTMQAVETLRLDATVEKVEDLMEIVRLGVMTSPSLMVDGKLVVSGHAAGTEKIMQLLQQE